MEIVLNVQSITTGYEENKILTDISFAVNKGEFIGIIGKNGAGKSTLLKALRGFLPIKAGTIQLFGRKLQDYEQRELATGISYLQQQIELTFDYTAWDMVLAGRYPYKKWWQQPGDDDKRIVEACMKYTGVHDLRRIPIKAMSGGQRQRVLLAKILAQQTPLLFLDEPAAGLDLFYQEEIFRFCQEMCKRGKTVIMVVHELNLAARYCSRLILINQGKILADGLPKAVLTDKLLSEAYGVDIRALVNPETGHTDIFTLPQPGTDEKNQLLNIIVGTGEAAERTGEL